MEKLEHIQDPKEKLFKIRIATLMQEMIPYIGEPLNFRKGIGDTPRRVANAYWEMFSGYRATAQDVVDLLTQFDGEQYDEIVLLKNIEFYSMCEHHMLPFFGTAHIGYIPNEKIVGISKLARLLDIFARKLQIQERICSDVVDALMNILQPKGAACVIEAKHLCIACRGVQKQHSVMVTSALRGCMKEDMNCRQEFMNLIRS